MPVEWALCSAKRLTLTPLETTSVFGSIFGSSQEAPTRFELVYEALQASA
jgi:hypothetical protein